ncbi:PDZ domain-containing protein [Planctomonas sp. JC2975]|uniref:YlbL family protein n=1 Tax=Planctomonas sp. JC2975 TaxID=2729626 RepID=UPI003211D902
MSLFSDDASASGSRSEGDRANGGGADDGGTVASESRVPRSRRIGAALVVVSFVLLLVMALSPVPYVIQAPGPVFNTLGYNHPVGTTPTNADEKKPLIVVSGHKTYPTKGSLDLLTVSEIGNPDQLPNWGEVITAWFSASRAVLPVDVAYPPGQNVQQQDAENAQLMTDSQKDAVAAALNELGYDFPQRIVVQQVVDGPAKGILEVGDVIVAVNGIDVKGVQSLRDQLEKNGAGTPASITIERDKKQQVVSVTPEKEAGAVVIGIGASMDYDFPFKVTIQLDNVGGPSAGQMFALGIMDKLTPGSLNGGARVAGTGTIDNEGNIGAIGGIRQKMYAARAAGATVFLAPTSNCDEVTGHVPSGLHVYSVTTLDDSLKVLDAVRTGGSTADLPTCPAS